MALQSVGISPTTPANETPILSISDASVAERDSETSLAEFTVSLSAPSEQTVSVGFWTSDGTAKTPVDYQPARLGEVAAHLTISKAGSQVTLSWSKLLDGYHLVMTEDLMGQWAAVTNTPVVAGDQFRVLLQARSAAREFYRMMPAVVFGPGELSKTITVLVNGDTIYEADETFFVTLNNPVNATIGNGQGMGTILNDDRANSPPTVRITGPENNATFLPACDVVIVAEAADPGGSIERVDFYAAATLIGSATNAPYTVTWSTIKTLGEYSLTAKATDTQRATTMSSPVLIKVANFSADVAVVTSFDDPEIAVIEADLFELGLTSEVLDPKVATFDPLKEFKLVIWDDLGQAGLHDQDVSNFLQAYNANIPIYFIGERLASSTTSLTEPYRSQWTELIHLRPATASGGDGTVTILTNGNHRVINGRFGAVEPFAYPAKVDQTSQTGTDQVLLGKSGTADVLIANEDPTTGVRSVSQNVLVMNGSNDGQSISERKRLFQDAVWWLLRKPLCVLTDLAISQNASAKLGTAGTELIYTLFVGNAAGCPGTGVIVTDILPPEVSFVSANTPQGTWSEADGVVTFHLGLLKEQEPTLQLTVTVTPTKSGQITNSVRIRGNEPDHDLGNNTSSLMTLVQAGATLPQGQSPKP